MIINLNKLNGGGSKLEYIIVEQLPSSGKKGAIYLVQKETSTEGDLYDEYIWINDKWEHVGTSTIDLSDYYTKEETDSTFATKDELPTVPTNVSAFDNDAQYITLSDIPTQVSAFENDANYQTSTDVASLLEPYATKDEIPTSTSQLSNDSGFITSDEVDAKIQDKADRTEIPTSTSQLTNDSDFITSSDIPYVPTNVSELDNDADYQTSLEVDRKLNSYVAKSGDTMSGNLTLGSGTETAYKKVEAIRNVNDVPNGAAFYTNSDGTASFFHKTYASTALTSPVNDAILKFDYNGLYFAKGANSRTNATDFKQVITDEKAITMVATLEDQTTVTFQLYGLQLD